MCHFFSISEKSKIISLRNICVDLKFNVKVLETYKELFLTGKMLRKVEGKITMFY
jgi:hypothetical protein